MIVIRVIVIRVIVKALCPMPRSRRKQWRFWNWKPERGWEKRRGGARATAGIVGRGMPG